MRLGLAYIILLIGCVTAQAQVIEWKSKPIIDLRISTKHLAENNAYKPFAWLKLVGYALVGLGGLKDGLVEGFDFDGRTSWERKRGVDPYSQRGSQSWRLAYVDGDPELGFKSSFHEWHGAWDWYHRNDDYRKLGYYSGGITLGIGGHKVNKKIKHYLFDFAIGWAVSATAKSIGMKFIRN